MKEIRSEQTAQTTHALHLVSPSDVQRAGKSATGKCTEGVDLPSPKDLSPKL